MKNRFLLHGWLPLLLILAFLLLIAGDEPFRSQNTPPSLFGNPSKFPGKPLDHNDPENNRRMGIFHFNEANKKLHEENWEGAVRDYRMALRHNKKMAAAYVNLSTAYFRMGQYGQALETLKTLKNIQPDHPLLYYNLGCYYSLTHQTDAALEALRRAVSLGFNDFEEIRRDPDLEHLRSDPRFKKWIGKLKGDWKG